MDELELQAAIGELIEEMEGEQGDPHEIFLRLKQLLDQTRAMGLPIPDDLARLEADLEREFAVPPDAET